MPDLQVSLQVPLQHLPPLRPGGLQGGAHLHEVLLPDRTDPPVRAERPGKGPVLGAAVAASPGRPEGGGQEHRDDRNSGSSGQHRQRIHQHLGRQDGCRNREPGEPAHQGPEDLTL